LSGAVFWSDIVGRVGLFDERLQYCEDSEFCRRVRAEGYKLLSFGDLGAFHTPKYSTLRIFAGKTWNYGVGRGRAVRQYWKLMTAVGLGAVSYTIVFATLLLLGLIMGSAEFRLLAILLGGLYLAAIVTSSLAISLRQGSAEVFFLSIAAYLTLHVPYTLGLMVGIIAPHR
jgi:GT2 family glycosyltransferase